MQLQLRQKQLMILLLCIESGTAIMIGAIVATQHSIKMGVLIGLAALAAPVVLIPIIMIPLSYLFGWRRLARRYPPAEPTPGATQSDVLACIALHRRLMQYNNCALWGADDEHLHLRMAFLFRAGHAPISIPWSEVLAIDNATMGFARLDLGWTRVWVPDAAVERERKVRGVMTSEHEHALG